MKYLQTFKIKKERFYEQSILTWNNYISLRILQSIVTESHSHKCHMGKRYPNSKHYICISIFVFSCFVTEASVITDQDGIFILVKLEESGDKI